MIRHTANSARQWLIQSAASASLLLASAPLGFAGEAVEKPTAKPAEHNPLSFFDGALVFDGEERLRLEIRNNNRDFNDSINDDNDDAWLLNRFRLGVTIKPVKWLKIYVQGQDAREWDADREPTPGIRGAEGDDAFDLRQAHVEIANYKTFPLGLTIGRQVIDYGDRRLVGDSKWGNLGRTFDAVRLRLQEPHFWLEGFFARPVQAKRDQFNDSDAEDNFGGLYFSADYIPWQVTELFAFYRDKTDNQSNLDPVNRFDPAGASNGPAQRVTTLGARIKSTPDAWNGWDYGAEFAFQFGDAWESDRASRRLDVHTFALHVMGGYTFENVAWKPRVGLEYDYATGDKDPNDGKTESFQTLFPANHEKYGFMDEFSWRNIHDARLQLIAKPTKKLELELDYHAFWLADTSDYWYRSNGISTLRTRTPDGRDVRAVGASNFAGQELDFLASYSPTKNLKLQAGYSHFFGGSYLRDTGTADNAQFGYVQAVLQF